MDLWPDGSVAKVGNFIQLSGGAGLDGLALDANGGLAVAHLGLGTVWIFDAIGQPVARVSSCNGLHTTSVAYGGAGNKTLFITEAGSATILAADLDVEGKAMHAHTQAGTRIRKTP